MVTKNTSGTKTAARKPAKTIDFEVPWNLDRSSSQSASTELTWVDINLWIGRLAEKVTRYKPDVVIGIAHGGIYVGNALAYSLKVPFFPVRISRRSRDVEGQSRARVQTGVPKDVKGKKVLLVDDVSQSGETLTLAKQMAIMAGAKKVATACLVSRPKGFEPDFDVEHHNRFLVFPWDLAPVAEDGRPLM